MSALLSTGQELPKALGLAADVVLSAQLKAQLASLGNRVSQGSHLSEALSQLEGIDPHIGWAAAAGESQENLGLSLQRAAEHLERRVSAESAFLLRLLEPAAIALVGLLTVALLVPFWVSLYHTAQNLAP
jgi:type IV pilus assembly protein PilC